MPNRSELDFQRLVDLANGRMYELVGLMQPILLTDRFSPVERQTLSWLSTASVRASGSALLLVGFGKVWDAEILSRSVFEGTLKFCHLLGDSENYAVRFREYQDALPDISALADHDKAKRVLDLAKNAPATRAALGELLLSDTERDEISARHPKQERRRLQTAWGVTGLIEQMVRSGEGMNELANGLLHGYAMASHVAHADYIGIGMAMEREYRPPERRNVAMRAHAARVISDQLWYCALRLIVGYRFLGESEKPISELMQDGCELWEGLRRAQEDWYRVEYGNDPA